MKRLLICSSSDISSVNIKNQLIKKNDWEDLGSDGTNYYCARHEDFLMTIPETHVYANDVDKIAKSFNIKFDEILVLSKHSAASGIPTLTVHPIGNFKGADLGGKPETLVKASPARMTDSLRKLKEYNNLPEYKVCFEVTHHGPYVEYPTYYIEIGSEETHWGDEKAAEIIAKVVETCETNGYLNAFGVGGGHYAPRFTEVAFEYKINFGHMIPNYQIDNMDDDTLIKYFKMASDASDTKVAYVHKKSFKKPEERRISSLLESSGYETISSNDLEPLL